MSRRRNSWQLPCSALQADSFPSLRIVCIILFQDHIQEVLDKWESIDDEIWAKVTTILYSTSNTKIIH